MRVLHINSGNLYGGIETLLTTLARLRALCPDMEPEFALCFDGRSSEELRRTSVPVHQLGPVRVSRPWTIWRGRRALGRLLTERPPDIVVCHGSWNHALFGLVVRRHRVPLVFWAHGSAAKDHWLDIWASRTQPDFVLADSCWTRENFHLFPGLPTEIVYYPFAESAVADRGVVRREIRAEAGVPDETVVIVQASRMEAWKGHELLLEALARLHDVAGWECWIVGGAQRPEEERYLSSLRTKAAARGIAGRVRFLGQRRDVPRLLAAADVHCQPNRDPEPFGIAFVEALYAGLPVVTTAQGGPLEIVNESCAILAPVGDEIALARTLKNLILQPDLRNCLGNAGPSRARDLCDPKRALSRLAQHLSERIPTPSAKPRTAMEVSC
jgi:glycosyltransferase involved in cell wall biosynthesis